jgi:hypothetical protein
LNRHPDLKLKRARRIDAARVKEISPEKVTEWIDAVEQVVDELMNRRQAVQLNERI